MAVADRYSRLVLWLKVALPLVALAILSTLFFVAKTLDPEAAIPYADVDVAKILREQGITNPSFGGVATNGVEVSLLAEEIRPGAERSDRLTGRTLTASLNLPSGTQIRITSPIGIVDAENEQAILQGGTTFTSSTGYLVETDEMTASLATATVFAPNTVNAEGPPGNLTAGQMELTRGQTPDEPYLMVFKGGVRLLYTP